jgi:predicted Zn finger-like uncharacterized protein
MEIVCNDCQSQFNIPDEKIPTDRTAKLTCPKCKNKITIEPKTAQAPSIEEAFAAFTGDTYDASEKPFDFIEEEGKTALVCETDGQLSKQITKDLDLMEYHTTVAQSGRDALKKMRYHNYDLVIVDEAFNSEGPDTNVVLLYLERLYMAVRRHIFVAMISHKLRTMDQMAAFRYSVNLIINSKNIEDFGKVLSRAITDHEMFYRPYTEALKEAGRL